MLWKNVTIVYSKPLRTEQHENKERLKYVKILDSIYPFLVSFSFNCLNFTTQTKLPFYGEKQYS